MNWEISESRDTKFIDERSKTGTFHGSMQVHLLVDGYVSELRPVNYSVKRVRLVLVEKSVAYLIDIFSKKGDYSY